MLRSGFFGALPRAIGEECCGAFCEIVSQLRDGLALGARQISARAQGRAPMTGLSKMILPVLARAVRCTVKRDLVIEHGQYVGGLNG